VAANGYRTWSWVWLASKSGLFAAVNADDPDKHAIIA